jgi:hypothetical protein
MARADLSSMLSRLEEHTPAQAAPAAEPTPATSQAAPVTPETAKARKPKSAAARAATTVTPTSEPLYLRLERKETRLRADQYADLTELARRLSRAKGPGGERITENTLIRIAIDVLLEHASELNGHTESELKQSVTL